MSTASATRIRVAAGHLTAREKSAISYMLANSMTSGKTARLTLRLESDPAQPDNPSAYRVTTSRVEKDDWGRRVTRTDRASFEVIS